MIVEDCPLLLEKGLDAECDHLVFVDAAPRVRFNRVHRGRGWSLQELRRRESLQLPLDTKARRADYIIDNNGDEAACLSHVLRMVAKILPQPSPQ